MENRLTFTLSEKQYVSKPFDFEAMCIINDAHNDESIKGPFNMCREGVNYMFEGTEAAQEVIEALDVSERTRLCMKLWGFYMMTLSKVVKA